jgi:hypothetical protein
MKTPYAINAAVDSMTYAWVFLLASFEDKSI